MLKMVICTPKNGINSVRNQIEDWNLSFQSRYAQQASNLNIEGVMLLSSFQLDKALETFKNALVLLNLATCERYSKCKPQNTHTTQNCDDAMPASQKSQIDNGFSSLLHHFTQVKIPALEDNKFFIYNRALIFDNSDRTNPKGSILDTKFFAMLINFNAALCYHLKSQVTSRNLTDRRVSLQKAKVLYLSCSQYMKQFRFHTEDTLFLMAGALNNEAQIQLEFADFSRVTQLLDQLKRIIVAASKPVIGSISSMHKEDHINLKENLALNVLSAHQFINIAPSA